MSELNRRLLGNKLGGQLNNSKPPSFAASHKVSYDPILWNTYFDYKEDLQLETGTFRIYRRGVEGPLLFFLHGGGFSALSWSLLCEMLTEEVNCQCLAMDIRGHGDTRSNDDSDMSSDTLASDVAQIILSMYPTEAPPIILVGHSMGGAIAVHAAYKKLVPSLAGLVVIDVVEGSALTALCSMQEFLRSRPKTFKSLTHGIEWSVRSHQIRNPTSARISFPGQLKRIASNDTATSEMERGLHCVSPETLPGETSRVLLDERQADIIEEENEEDSKKGLPPTVPRPSAGRCKTTDSSPPEYTWRIDLTSTEPYWEGWFEGLSSKFLAVPQPKLLLLAGVDRLDKELTIGQMQGKFQMHILPQSGHAVHEDVPDKVADCMATFLVRNQFAEPRSNEKR